MGPRKIKRQLRIPFSNLSMSTPRQKLETRGALSVNRVARAAGLARKKGDFESHARRVGDFLDSRKSNDYSHLIGASGMRSITARGKILLKNAKRRLPLIKKVRTRLNLRKTVERN